MTPDITTQDIPDIITIEGTNFKLLEPSLETIESATKIFFRSFSSTEDASQGGMKFLENALSLLPTEEIYKHYLVYDDDCTNYRNITSQQELLDFIKKPRLLMKLKLHHAKKCLFFVVSGLA